MKIQKVLNEDGTPTISITKDNQTLRMFYGGNGDLYWELINPDKPLLDEGFFVIDKENYLLFSSFNNLYRSIEECEIYEVDPLELELCEDGEEVKALEDQRDRLNEDARTSREYDELYSESGITFVSDEDVSYYDENTTSLVKSYDGESIIIEFKKGTPKRDSLDIRFRTSGSRFGELVTPFLKHFNALANEDFNYHQIHLEELAYQKKLSKKKGE